MRDLNLKATIPFAFHIVNGTVSAQHVYSRATSSASASAVMNITRIHRCGDLVLVASRRHHSQSLLNVHAEEAFRGERLLVAYSSV
jgi:hypothetical protein